MNLRKKFVVLLSALLLVPLLAGCRLIVPDDSRLTAGLLRGMEVRRPQ